MERKEWWNKLMTRKNWLVLIIFSVSISLIKIGYVFYAGSIKKAANNWNDYVSAMTNHVKQRF